MPKFYVGTSGWSFPELIEKFNIAKESDAKEGGITEGGKGTYAVLGFYAGRLNSVENNSAFYHFPRPATLQKWYDATPDDFKFSLKLHQSFTHDNLLRLDSAGTGLKNAAGTGELKTEKLKEFLTNTQVLKEKLGALLLQLPPSLVFDPVVVDKFFMVLSEIISTLEFHPRLAIEPRHNSWFAADAYKLFRKYNIALVIAQSAKYPSVDIVTADFLYLRFHGPKSLYSSTYSQQELDQRFRSLAAMIEDPNNKIPNKIEEVYIYFNNTMSGSALLNADYIQQLANR